MKSLKDKLSVFRKRNEKPLLLFAFGSLYYAFFYFSIRDDAALAEQFQTTLIFAFIQTPIVVGFLDIYINMNTPNREEEQGERLERLEDTNEKLEKKIYQVNEKLERLESNMDFLVNHIKRTTIKIPDEESVGLLYELDPQTKVEKQI